MDVNAVKYSEGSSQAVASPVVPAAPPVTVESPKNGATERIKADSFEFSQGSQGRVAESPLVANSDQNIRNGSQVFHDDATNQFVVQIVNENNEVIRQLPPEEALRIAARFRQVIRLLFDQST